LRLTFIHNDAWRLADQLQKGNQWQPHNVTGGGSSSLKI
jgi:hypothetical protein